MKIHAVGGKLQREARTIKTVAIYTLGCRVNQYESQAVLELFLKEGYQAGDFHAPCDVYVINTCSVTAEGDRKSRQAMRRARKQNPEAVVAVMGCYAQLNREALVASGLADVIVGTEGRADIVQLAEAALATRREKATTSPDAGSAASVCAGAKERKSGFEPLSISTYEGRTRAFVKIQEGCRQFCSYCIIPYARGPLRSRPEEDVVREAERLAANGFLEIVLTGIHLASYGQDTGRDSLLSLLRKLDGVDGICRVRLGSLEPNGMDETFVGQLGSVRKLCPHFHISLQSGCDATLARMNRRYTAEQYRGYIEAIRREMPGAAITTDVMVGFPGETEEEFAASYEFVRSMEFSHVHTFIYSRRSGTPAATMPDQVPAALQKERSRRILELSGRSRAAFLQRQVGTKTEVLFEQALADGMVEGFTPNYLSVRAPGGEALRNRILPVWIIGVEAEALVGQIVEL